MNYLEIIEKIKERAEELGIDLDSLGLYETEDFVNTALCFLYQHLEDLDGEEVQIDFSEETLDEEEEDMV